VGITAKSLHKFGLDVTAVEIDPVVHRFAEEFFGLPKMSVVYQDGRGFLERTKEKWDYIIHDVFTGGNVPAHLFTREMWIATKNALHDFGVLVVVYFSPLPLI
jgi:spermidine synthase